MSYRVIRDFSDAQDGYHCYKAGDSFPRDGVAVSEARLKSLESAQNALRTPLIEAEGESIAEVKKPSKRAQKSK